MNERLSIDDAISKLNDEDVEVRMWAVNNLEGIEDEKIIQPLIETLKDENPLIKHKVAKILGDMGELAADFLIVTVDKEEGDFKKFASFALKETRSKKATDYFVDCLDNVDWGIRKIAVRSLGELEAVEHIDLISDAMNDDDWGVRLAAIRSLGDLEVEEAIDPIKKARRKEKNKDFKKAANKAIKQIEKAIKKK
ncbi:MAG: HEAT repeat domain-containing protein [Methanobrevibacter sp.]|jgi:HEAT repeat protein|nr:HEAT repeat domain-containing protein [Candidatus Methanovirga aequatorialis]